MEIKVAHHYHLQSKINGLHTGSGTEVWHVNNLWEVKTNVNFTLEKPFRHRFKNYFNMISAFGASKVPCLTFKKTFNWTNKPDPNYLNGCEWIKVFVGSVCIDVVTVKVSQNLHHVILERVIFMTNFYIFFLLFFNGFSSRMPSWLDDLNSMSLASFANS